MSVIHLDKDGHLFHTCVQKNLRYKNIQSSYNRAVSVFKEVIMG